MEINKDEFVEKFIDQHPELFLEFKWSALLAMISEDRLWEGRADLKEGTIAFLEVFHKHNVDPEVVMEAMQVISEREKDKTTNMSKAELTNFVSTLMKIHEQQKEDEEKEENDA